MKKKRRATPRKKRPDAVNQPVPPRHGDRPARGVEYIPRGFVPSYLGICVDPAGWGREAKRLGVKDEFTEAYGSVHTFSRNGSPKILMMMVNAKRLRRASAREIHGIIVHELTHVWQSVKKEMNEERPGDEVEAYTMQTLALEYFNAYDRLAKGLR
jgi:hypothetical protein